MRRIAFPALALAAAFVATFFAADFLLLTLTGSRHTSAVRVLALGTGLLAAMLTRTRLAKKPN